MISEQKRRGTGTRRGTQINCRPSIILIDRRATILIALTCEEMVNRMEYL